MALRARLVAAVFFFTFALANLELSACHVVKGSVSCLDCKQGHDLSGIKVLVKCDKVKKLSVATTLENGFFETELPSDSVPQPLVSCRASVMGGPRQLYASRKQMVTKVVAMRKAQAHDSTVSYYTVATPLAVYTACARCGPEARGSVFGSSKTIDLPIPKEWGFAPTSYYVPILPIIGIP